MTELNYKDLQKEFSNHFSLGNLGVDITNKFALISFICFLTKQARGKNPDASCYQVIMKVINGEYANAQYLDFIKGLSIICEDFMYGCTEFPLFGFKTSKEIMGKIKEILDTWLPF